MSTVTSILTCKYHIHKKVTSSDIDFGATPDRTNKSITLRCTTLKEEIKEMGVGAFIYTILVPVSIDIYQRRRVLPGLREESQSLIDIEKSLVNFFAINRLSLQQYGINHAQVRSIQTTLDDTEEWYHTKVIVDTFYQMRATGE